MTPDHPYPVRDRGPGHPARGSEPITLVRHGVVRGHVVTAVGVLRGRLAEPWTWAIENREHYVRDKTFGEDFQRVRTGNQPNAYTTIRNVVTGDTPENRRQEHRSHNTNTPGPW